jgi:hypothetical protein
LFIIVYLMSDVLQQMWATLEIQTTERFLKNIISNKEALRICALVFTCLAVLLMVSAGVLMIGIMLVSNTSL